MTEELEFYTEENYELVKKYFPEGYNLNVDYTVFIKILAGFLSDIKPHIESFTELVDLDKCPAKFLPFLGSLIGYEYDYTKSSRANRFIMHYYLEAYRRRGTESALKLVTRIAAIDELEDDVPDEEKYFHYLFDPNVSEEENQIILPRQFIFRWGNELHGYYSSDYSTVYAYPSTTAVPLDKLPGSPPIDWYYNNSTFDIFAPNITILLRDLMRWVIPAGMRVYWSMIYYMNKIDFSQYYSTDTDIIVYAGETYRHIFFNYKTKDDERWSRTLIYDADPAELFGTTYQVDEVVELEDNTLYTYKLVVGFPHYDYDTDSYIVEYVEGQEKEYLSIIYPCSTSITFKGFKNRDTNIENSLVSSLEIKGFNNRDVDIENSLVSSLEIIGDKFEPPAE